MKKEPAYLIIALITGCALLFSCSNKGYKGNETSSHWSVQKKAQPKASRVPGSGLPTIIYIEM